MPIPLLALLAVADPLASRVLVVANRNSADSMRIAGYYAKKRGVPTANVLLISTADNEEIAKTAYQSEIETPIRQTVAALRKPVDYIVLTKGIPIRFSDWGTSGGYAVDAMVAADRLALPEITKLEDPDIERSANPYFKKTEPFSHSKFGFYLVTRLDGYTVDDALKLVDDALAAKPAKGPFFFDEADNRKGKDYSDMQDTLTRANSLLKGKGFDSSSDATPTFVAPTEPLAGYASWGSNDGAFNLETYKKLRFLPGALVETFVSTSGRTFRPTTGGQSLIADLVANGVTGIKGYVSEPYTFALARPDILFDRYTSGYNLAESFYMASPVLKWKDVVVGDPLCNPYKR
jgi:uncharacterized protein (TIGR03790 family)